MESETVQTFLSNDWNSYGEEIVLVATSCCNRLYENHYGAAVSTIMETQQQLAQCICLWDSLDSYVYTQVMNLIDMLGAQHNDDVQPLIGFYMQPERLNNIDDLEKLATILLVIVKHIKKPSEVSSLMAVLQVKYQFQDTNQAASLAASAYKDGYLGVCYLYYRHVHTNYFQERSSITWTTSCFVHGENAARIAGYLCSCWRERTETSHYNDCCDFRT